jgi:LGFP repeat
MIVDGIKQRANIAFILRYPNQFDLLDGSLDALKKNYDTIQATLPKLAVIARDCAEELEKCDMTGISPFAVELPQRLATANIDPIEEKWWSLERDERALPSFEREPVPDFLAWFNGPRGGRYKLFYNENREIVSGIFWCLEHGACAVYGEIMREYVRRGHCNGPLGYPKTDELAGDDGVGRVSWFENDALWWTPERGVGDGLPPFLRVTPWPGPTPLPPIGI